MKTTILTHDSINGKPINPIDVRSLASLKRFLALEGAAVTMLSHSWWNNGIRPLINITRRVKRLQTNGVQFVGGSWLYFDRGPVTDNFQFYGAAGNRFKVDLRQDGSFVEFIDYLLSIEETE